MIGNLSAILLSVEDDEATFAVTGAMVMWEFAKGREGNY